MILPDWVAGFLLGGAKAIVRGLTRGEIEAIVVRPARGAGGFAPRPRARSAVLRDLGIAWVPDQRRNPHAQPRATAKDADPRSGAGRAPSNPE